MNLSDDDIQKILLETIGTQPVHRGGRGRGRGAEAEDRSIHRDKTLLAPAERLLVYSKVFQNNLLEDEREDIPQLFYHSWMLRVISWKDMQFVCQFTKFVYMQKDQVLTFTRRSILAVQSGAVTVTYLDHLGKSHKVFLQKNSVVGEAWALMNVAQISWIDADSMSIVVLLPSIALEILFEMRHELMLSMATLMKALVVQEQGSSTSSSSTVRMLQLFELLAIQNISNIAQT